MFESRQFMTGRGLITYSLEMPFLPQRNIAFSTFCVLSVTHSLKTLVGGHFSLAISPGGVTVGKAPHSQVSSKALPNICSITFSWWGHSSM